MRASKETPARRALGDLPLGDIREGSRRTIPSNEVGSR
jgi:hypothetical protein